MLVKRFPNMCVSLKFVLLSEHDNKTINIMVLIAFLYKVLSSLILKYFHDIPIGEKILVLPTSAAFS